MVESAYYLIQVWLSNSQSGQIKLKVNSGIFQFIERWCSSQLVSVSDWCWSFQHNQGLQKISPGFEMITNSMHGI